MSNFTNNVLRFGDQDTSYKAAGEESGLKELAIDFYRYMNELPEAKRIRLMHQEDLELMTDKLALFLSMWLGGPKKYKEKYNTAGMPAVHKHLVINEPERDAWLFCMDKAIDQRPYSIEFKDYLKKQFRFPAEMIRKSSKNE